MAAALTDRRAGKKLSARLKMGVEGKVEFDFGVPGSSPQTPAPKAPASTSRRATDPETAAEAWPACPKCGQGQIIQGKRGFGCSRYREGCDFVVWRQSVTKS